jgi:methyltransferase-like protein
MSIRLARSGRSRKRAKKLPAFARAVARRQAQFRPMVANLRHRMVSLIDFDQLVLSYLDGRHDRRALLAKMRDEVKHRGFAISSNGLPITDPANAELELQISLMKASIVWPPAPCLSDERAGLARKGAAGHIARGATMTATVIS